MRREVRIDAGPPCAQPFDEDDAVIVVDVIRATTTAVTAAARGGRCLPVASLAEAWQLAGALFRPLLVGELAGSRPDGFHLSNSPSAIARRRDLTERPMILLSSSGTPLMGAVAAAGAIYPACLRNWRAVADHVATRHARVHVLGAATRGEFRDEDQLCCAFIARRLVESGFAIGDLVTARALRRWGDAPPEALLGSPSVRWLRKTGQLHDVAFILRHVDDLDAVFRLDGGELVPVDGAVQWGRGNDAMRNSGSRAASRSLRRARRLS